MSIIVSGSLAYDYIMNFPDSFKNHLLPEQLHILSVCFNVDKLEKNFGGTAGNIAYTLKLLGEEPVVVSALGKDSQDYQQYLASLNITTEYIKIIPNIMSATAHITTDQDDNQIIAFFPGPLEAAKDTRLKTIPAATMCLVSPTHKAAMIKHLAEARQQGLTVVFDPGQQITAFNENELKHLIEEADFIIGNDYEIKLIEQKTGWSGTELVGGKRILITTLGARGSIITTPEGLIEIASCPPLSADDPTGAGDGYRAGFFAGLNRGQGLKTCGQMGSVAASFAIETYGTQTHRFTIHAFKDRYEKTYNEKLSL